MPNIPIPSTSASTAHLRIVRDEDRPPYDGDPPTTLREPFTMIPDAVRQLADGYALAVFEAIARHANVEGTAWPSLATICEHTGWSKNLVLKSIKTLIERGIVTKELRFLNGMSRSTAYQITANVQVFASGTAVFTKSHFRERSGVHGEDTAVHQEDSGCSPGEHELDTVELEPIKNVNPLPPTSKPKPKKAVSYADDFEVFWRLYSTHDRNGRSEKPETAKLWESLSEQERAAAMAALPLFAAGHDWTKGFVPGAQVWVRKRKWENPPKASTGNGSPHPPYDRAEEDRNRLKMGWEPAWGSANGGIDAL